ncbi:hypothetical protein E1B28_006025 [Marasmius oreades]|uniref:RING-type domain-containing protein n=1 Tax=Marasmius oreades TaxID=181124 RepID=A0A9P7UUU8_9AGAR|nr:uncharacterized protein E1B28_006025 [Marasmius oreades]KAG7095252.1 hypothetical protein E1B28_006025 [Marasmius oreades]
MVLTVHASSTCDVCLEPYDWDDNVRKPHFINCGHVFCGTCLEHVQPKKCPLCRELFTASDIQRLNVDPHPGHIYPQRSDVQINGPQSFDDPDEIVNDLMKKLVISYDSVDDELLSSTDTWLQGREFLENCPVRKARAMIQNYQDLKQRKTQDKETIRNLRSAVQDSRRKAEECAARLEEEVRRKDDLRRLIDENQKEIERLREKIKIQGSLLDLKGKKKQSNPLPAPPRLVGASTLLAHQLLLDRAATPASVGVDTSYPVRDIHAPTPRYPDSHACPPGIVHSFGLLTFNNPAYGGATASVEKYQGHNQPQVCVPDLGPGQVVDDATYWTCPTTTHLLPEPRSPGDGRYRGPIVEHTKKGRSKRHRV